MSDVMFGVTDFAGWTPDLPETRDWARWAHQPRALGDGGAPEIPLVPALQRRRIDRMGRMAICSTWRVDPNGDADAYVFATPLGEVHRSVQLLSTAARGEALSPSTFASSVHNAIGAAYSIARGIRSPVVAVAAGGETLAAAFLEAAGALSDGCASVVVTVYDEPIPDVYAGVGCGGPAPFSWSCRLTSASDAGPTLTLALGESDPLLETHSAGLNDPLEVARLLLGARPSVVTAGGWTWSRRP
jgi:hypothetical protein